MKKPLIIKHVACTDLINDPGPWEDQLSKLREEGYAVRDSSIFDGYMIYHLQLVEPDPVVHTERNPIQVLLAKLGAAPETTPGAARVSPLLGELLDRMEAATLHPLPGKEEEMFTAAFERIIKGMPIEMMAQLAKEIGEVKKDHLANCADGPGCSVSTLLAKLEPKLFEKVRANTQ